jgi:glycosyltransferase involved in cell wall biosynthesis
MHARRPTVLLVAEAANPEWVSVPLVGWSLSQALRQVADVHLVTQARNREAILRAGLEEGRDFTALDTERVARPLHRLAQLLRGGSNRGWTINTAIQALGYPYFERLIWQRFCADLRAGRYDLVHRIVPLTPTTVSPIARHLARHDIPFVIGPLNGGVPWPPGYEEARAREGDGLSRLRDLHRALPGRARMLRDAAAILAGSSHTEAELRAQMPAGRRQRLVWLPENAIDPARFPERAAAPDPDGPLRGCFVGRLVPYKGPDLLLEAATPLLRAGRMALDIVGDGPLMPALREHVAREGLADAVTLHGNLPHEAVAGVLGRAHVLPFPSVREFGGGVVLEAMAMGVVPVIADYAGPAELVDEATAFRLPLGAGRDDLRRALAERLGALARDRAPLPAMAEAGRRAVRERFTWAAKAGQIREVYDQVLADPTGSAPLSPPLGPPGTGADPH